MKDKCAFNKNGGCRILYGSCRNQDGCRFKKTDDQVAESLHRAALRLAQLPQEKQDEIAQKYYCGKRAWCGWILTTKDKPCPYWGGACYTCPWEDCKAGQAVTISEEET